MSRLPKHGLTHAILNTLGSEIVSGVYSAAHPFPIEAQQCTRFHASRSVMREAIKMLTAKGLLASKPKYGTWVTPEDQWNLLDPDVLRWLLERDLPIDILVEFTEIRMAIEPLAARLAIARATTAQKQALRDAVAAMEAAEKGLGDPLQTDIDLHIAVLNASNNRFLIQHRDLVQTALTFSIRLANRMKSVPIADVAEHRKIVDGICNGDEALACGAIQHLLDTAMEFILKAKEAGVPRDIRHNEPLNAA
ncbi:MAG: FadR/GntR family transcriptional regulator [Asticcacaulis sp.]